MSENVRAKTLVRSCETGHFPPEKSNTTAV